MMASPALPEAATFSYAAAASGRSSSTATTKSPASKSHSPSPAPNGTPANGTADSNTQSPTPRSAPSSGEVPMKPSRETSTTALEAVRQSSPNIGAMSMAKEDDSETTALSVPDEKSNAWEKSSQSSSHGDNRTSSSGDSTTETSKTNEHLVEAAPPAINVWKKRQEEMAAKFKGTPSSTSIPSSSPSHVSKSSNSSVVKTSSGHEEPKQPETKPNGTTWKDKGQSKDEQSSEGKGDDESRDATKNALPAAKEDGSSKQSRLSKKGSSQDKEAFPSIPPPPVTDAMSWPAPGSFSPVEKPKEKVEKEKEKIAQSTGRTKTWLPVTIDTPYTPPIQTKSSRGGRGGGRGAREGGRGGSSQPVDRSAGTGPVEGTSESDRGRSSYGPSGRGGYQGGKTSKRSTSPGGTIQRRESKGFNDRNAGERRKESKDGGEWYPDASVSNKISASTQTDRPRRESRDTLKTSSEGQLGDTRQYGEAPERYNSNGYGYPPRGSQSYGNSRADSEAPNGYPSRDRGSERGRGGYRRGGYYQNGHAHYQGQSTYSPASQYHNHQSGQPFSQSRSFRGQRGHPQFSNGGIYRYNPQMQTPPAFPPPYNVEYNYMPPPSSIPMEIGALTTQLNYYFSVENLCKDVYLRKHMNSQGFVRLSFIAGFNRVKMVTEDINLLQHACYTSDQLDLQISNSGEYFVRKKEGWDNWVLKEEDRDESARDDRRGWHTDPHQRTDLCSLTGTWVSANLPSTGSGNQTLSDPTASYYPAPIDTSTYNSYTYPMSASTLSANVPDFSPYTPTYGNGTMPNGSVSPMPNEVTDAQLDQLIIVCKRPEAAEVSSNRTRPNGNNEKSVNEILQDTGLTNGTTEDSSSRHHNQKSQGDVGWIMGSLVEAEKTLEQAEGNLVHMPYHQFLHQALKKRDLSRPGRSGADMLSLYKFWYHYLVENNSNTMYTQFKKVALEDADASTRTGIEYIFKYYTALFTKGEDVRLSMVQDFVTLAKADARHGEALGVDKVKVVLGKPDLKTYIKHMIESQLDDEIRTVINHGVGKKHEKSPAPDSYIALVTA